MQTRTPRADGTTDMEEGGTALATHSRLRKWWLTTFRGYRVHSASHAPKQSALGRLTYVSHWWLEPPSDGN
jgi:hypothetical protein